MHKARGSIWLKNPWNLTERQAHRLRRTGTPQPQDQPCLPPQAKLLPFTSMGVSPCSDPGRSWIALTAKWFWWATHSRLEPMRDFAWMLRRHEKGAPSTYFLRADRQRYGRRAFNNRGEASKIRKAYGFRTAKNYIRNLYHCLGNLPLPDRPCIHSCEEPLMLRRLATISCLSQHRIYCETLHPPNAALRWP